MLGYIMRWPSKVRRMVNFGFAWVAQIANVGKILKPIDAYTRAYELAYQQAHAALRLASLEAARKNDSVAVNWFVLARSLHLTNAEQELFAR